METLSNDAWKEKFLDKLIVGDSLKLLKEIPDNSINLIITSPPYFQQRDYEVEGAIGNEKSVEDYLEKILKVFHEAVRITRPDGHIVFNLGDKYKDGSLMLVPWRFAIEAISREKVKLINYVTWIKLNPTPRQYKKRLVNATEPFFIFTKSDDYYFDIDSFNPDRRKVEKRRRSSNIGEKYFELIEKSDLTPEQKQFNRNDLVESLLAYYIYGESSGLQLNQLWTQIIREIMEKDVNEYMKNYEPYGGEYFSRSNFNFLLFSSVKQ